jgi:O-antigen ligase
VAVRPHHARVLAAGRILPVSLPGSAVLALALPVLFLHNDYQPGFTVHTGQASEHIVLSDLVLLAVGATALVAGLRRGFAPLRAGRLIWIAGAIFLLDVGAGSVYPKLWSSGYEASTHAVTAAKFAEYALLSLSVPLLVRARRDVELLLAALVAWSVVATVAGSAQILGADILEAWAAGRRQPSFLGHHDFASLSGAALTLCLVGLALRPVWKPPPALLAVAGVSGGVGLIISGSSAGAIGLGIGVAALALGARLRGWLDRRRLLAVVAITAVVVGGVFGMRAGNIDQFLRFVGIGQAQRQNGVQSYVQRTLLVYIGWRIFEDNPIGGAGWQASSEYRVYGPYLPAAHREFPGSPDQAFPSPQHPWGVQNAYVQAMADLGVVGLIAFLGLLLTALAVTARAVLRAPPAVAVTALVALVWLILVMGVLSALGLVAGIPTDALLWLSLGFCVLAAGGRELVRA